MDYKQEAKERFKKVFGREPDLKSPTTFNEKLLFLNVSADNAENFKRSEFSDKLKLRDILVKKFGKDIGIPIKAVFGKDCNLKEIKFPGKHVAKCNHGFGMNFFFEDHLSKKQIKVIESCLCTSWARKNFEEWYKFIDRKVIIEEALDGEVRDIHVLCFNGTAKIYEEPYFPSNPGRIYDEDGDPDEEFKLSDDTHISYYDADWNFLPNIVRARVPSVIKTPSEKPKNLDKIKKYAEKLAKDFKFVRVDFIVNGDNVYCEKVVFSPGGGFSPFLGDGDEVLGKMLKV